MTSIPVEKFVAIAGQNVTLPCPGVYEHSLVNALTWKTASANVAQYANGIPLVYNTRVNTHIDGAQNEDNNVFFGVGWGRLADSAAAAQL